MASYVAFGTETDPCPRCDHPIGWHGANTKGCSYDYFVEPGLPSAFCRCSLQPVRTGARRVLEDTIGDRIEQLARGAWIPGTARTGVVIEEGS